MVGYATLGLMRPEPDARSLVAEVKSRQESGTGVWATVHATGEKQQ